MPAGDEQMKPRLFRSLLLPVLGLLLLVAIGYGAYRVSEHLGIQGLRESGQRQLELQARAVESELDKYTYLPRLLELEQSVLRLLHTPNALTRERVNGYLEALNLRSGSRAIYVLDPQGRVLATSNWQDADSYLGEDLSFRAYFQDALQGRPGRFYGIGSTIGEPGYYLAHGLRENGKVIGVAVVKMRLDMLEERWQRAYLEAYISDENGIIILSSEPGWRLKAVKPLDQQTKDRLAHSMQYYWWALNELQPLTREFLDAGLERLSFEPMDSSRHSTQVSYLAQTRPLEDSQWHFTLLTPLQDLQRDAVTRGMLATLGAALLAFLLIAWNERRKVLEARLDAREALQRANDELEHKIAERTADLMASNGLLKAEIKERRQVEDNLRKTQDDLVQSGKLAVIGQMSTSVAHELNQPLAALRTLSGNTIRFLQRGDLQTASANLQTINQLVDQMGRITASLRAFARRADDRGESHLGQAVAAALMMLQNRLEQLPVQVHHDYGDVCLAMEQTRLEQVLVNLIGNALDAMSNQPDRQLWLSGRVCDGHYRLAVRDNGSGIAPDMRGHLFEPFFTTKPGEKGLGLGLNLSASLAAAAGGHLEVRHPEGGGTEFELRLPLRTQPGSDNGQ